MAFEIVDRYLLGEPVSKPAAIEALLSPRSNDPAAAPFYRALEAVGPRAADEALIALRLVLAGRKPDDAAVRRLRALGAIARACAVNDRTGLQRTLKKDAGVLQDFADPANPPEMTRLRERARAAFARELAP